MKLRVRAPTRIDLAGGTFDIHPLYVFEGGGLTLNAAIDLFCEVEVSLRQDDRISIESVDLGRQRIFGSLSELASATDLDSLDLLVRISRFYLNRAGIALRTRSNVPPGSGLGGSSSLLVALSTALVIFQDLPYDKSRIIDCGADIEAQSIGVPTGKQDYFAAAFGGFSALRFAPGSVRREAMNLSPSFLEELHGALVLGYCGASRFSGSVNWNVLKSYVEKDKATRSALRSIKETTKTMHRSLLDEDLSRFGRCLGDEWRNRRALAEGVSNERIEKLFDGILEAGSAAVKICGAGGGGCFVALTRPGRRYQVEEAIRAQGGEVLEYRFANQGVHVVP